MDEINALIPGERPVERVIEPDEKDPSRMIVNFIYPELDPNIGEQALAMEYGEVMKAAMEGAMQYTFDLIGSDMPAGSSIEIGKWWIH